MRTSVLSLALLFALLGAAAPASADITGFIGSATTPTNRQVKGVAVGINLIVVGFEFEYANVQEDLERAAPALRTGSANVLVQTPISFAGIRPYATTGVGLYRESSGDSSLGSLLRETNVGLNTGGGVKVALIGPLRARLDYRVFKLRGTPQYSTVHRIYVGANLAF